MNEPYLDQNGDLIIPNQCDQKFQWWNDTVKDHMTLEEVLNYVGADDEVRARYLPSKKPFIPPTPPKVDNPGSE